MTTKGTATFILPPIAQHHQQPKARRYSDGLPTIAFLMEMPLQSIPYPFGTGPPFPNYPARQHLPRNTLHFPGAPPAQHERRIVSIEMGHGIRATAELRASPPYPKESWFGPCATART